MANLAQTINVLQAVILTKDEKMILTPTYHVMEMYNVHQDETMLPVKFNTEYYEFKGHKLPAVSVSASKDKDGIVHVSIVNIDPEKAHKLTLHFNGGSFKTVGGRILTSPKVQDYNSFNNPEKIKPEQFDGAKLSGQDVALELPHTSVVVLALK